MKALRQQIDTDQLPIDASAEDAMSSPLAFEILRGFPKSLVR